LRWRIAILVSAAIAIRYLDRQTKVFLFYLPLVPFLLVDMWYDVPLTHHLLKMKIRTQRKNRPTAFTNDWRKTRHQTITVVTCGNIDTLTIVINGMRDKTAECPSQPAKQDRSTSNSCRIVPPAFRTCHRTA
jgi:hypothetical protein